MSKRPKAPLTAHLRDRIQKRAKKIPPPPQNARPARSTTSDDAFQNTELYTWVRIPEDLDAKELDNLPKRKPDLPASLHGEVEDGENRASSEEKAKTEKFCALLNDLTDEFAAKKRPYCAMAAQSAIALTLEGKQDDINPGLWPFIRRMEEKQMRKEP